MSRRGYICLDDQRLHSLLSRARRDIVDAELFEQVPSPRRLQEILREFRPDLPSMTPGTPLRKSGRTYLLDAVSASRLLVRTLQYTSGQGAAANRRARRFEDSIQEMIDSSAMTPEPGLRNLVGSTVRDRSGVEITDLDCIAADDRLVLLIDCKSKLRSPRFETGDFRTVRNVRTALENDATQWREKVARIVESEAIPSAGRTVVGIVCCPFVPYLIAECATEFVIEGLRRVASSAELAAWISARHSRGLSLR